MSDTKLMKPLFYNGNFNADAKRMKAVFVKEVSNGTDAYRLWRGAGSPDRDYPRGENDTHLLYVEVGAYLAPLGMTEYDLTDCCGYPLAIAELYGDEDGREKRLDELRKANDAHAKAIPEALKAEGEAIRRLGSEPIHQANHIKSVLDGHISAFLTAKENDGQSFPDFVGAAAVKELALCRELSGKYREKRRKEAMLRQGQREAEDKKRREETNLHAEKQIQQALRILRHGGVLENEEIRFYREDGGFGRYSIINHLMRLYGVDVPLRTQGWINDKLASFTVENGRCNQLRYMRAKGCRGSEKFFECVNDLLKKVNGEETEVAA